MKTIKTIYLKCPHCHIEHITQYHEDLDKDDNTILQCEKCLGSALALYWRKNQSG